MTAGLRTFFFILSALDVMSCLPTSSHPDPSQDQLLPKARQIFSGGDDNLSVIVIRKGHHLSLRAVNGTSILNSHVLGGAVWRPHYPGKNQTERELQEVIMDFFESNSDFCYCRIKTHFS